MFLHCSTNFLASISSFYICIIQVQPTAMPNENGTLGKKVVHIQKGVCWKEIMYLKSAPPDLELLIEKLYIITS